jgi:hypothetical protein
MTVAITRQELDAAGLRGAAVRCRDELFKKASLSW